MENRRFSTKGLVEASILAVISALFIWMNINIPFFFIVGMLLIPLPVAIAYVRYGYKLAILSVIITFVLLIILGRPVEAVLEIINGMLPALVLGYCINKEKPAVTTILCTTIAAIAATIIAVLVSAIFLVPGGVQGLPSFANEQIDIVKGIFTQVRDTYKAMGFTEQQLKAIDQTIGMINLNSFLVALPAAMAISSFIASFATYMVIQKVLLRLNIRISKIRPLSTLYIDNRIGAAAIILLCISLLLDIKMGIAAAHYVASFIFMVGSFALMITGTSLVTYFLRQRFKLSKRKVIGIIIITVVLQLMPFYFGMGLTDMIFDVRRLDPNRIFKR